MSFQIIKKSDSRVVRAFTHKLADIPNGLTVTAADLSSETKVLKEGTPVGIDNNGLGHVIKQATVTAYDGTNKIATVAKGHDFKVGDYIFAAVGGKQYQITSIATNSNDNTKDDITTGTSLALSTGDVICQGTATAGATSGAFLFEPVGLLGDSYDVSGNNVCEVVTIGQIKEAVSAPVCGLIKGALKNIKFI